MPKRRILKRRRDGVKQHYIVGSRGNNAYRKRPTLNGNRLKQTIKTYSDKQMDNIIIKNGKISGTYDNKRIRYPFKKINHLETIGNWDHKLKKHSIIIDKDVKKNNVKPLLIHEAVEQYLVKEKDMPISEAHKIATNAEEKYVKSNRNNWRGYQISVAKTKI